MGVSEIMDPDDLDLRFLTSCYLSILDDLGGR
ncbi:MAG: hypothetical protein FD133_1482 [Erysipelotrichaceae bacterium]|nr:MAG: hypothetical protein FD179_1717 [Erysipelotrichaceae bacterium]TXT17242.1 MAG: hypothetical protein FD133_1482 [Erysipelotrichaceae bacterium]